MGYINYRLLSLIVAWLHIVGSTITAIALCYTMIAWRNMEYYGSAVERNIYNVVHLSCLVICCILSVLLVRGIKKNRAEFMAAWIYAYYVVFGVLIGWTIYIIIDAQKAAAPFPLVILVLVEYLSLLAISLFVFFPVYKMYKQLLTLLPGPGN